MDHSQDEFQRFERAGWERVPEAYESAFGPLTRQSVPALLEAVGTAPGTRLLDVCTGHGPVAVEAARRGALVTAVDFSEAMVAHSAQRHAEVDFRVADAQELPFEDASFDAVVIAFGLLHLARPDDALREACRVLRPGGNVATVVWRPPERARGFALVLDAVRSCGTFEAGLPSGPDFFRFGEEEECQRSFQAAGFEQVRCLEVPQTWCLPRAEDLFRAMLEGTVRTAGLMAAQTPHALQAIEAGVRSSMQEFSSGAGFELPMPALLTRAVRPDQAG